jgi:hypothetical protein
MGGAGTGGRAGDSGGRGGAGGGVGGAQNDGPAGSGGAPADSGADLTDAPSGPEGGAEVTADLPAERPADLPVEVPPRSKADGTACLVGMECVSGVCAKGLCCNKACDEPCYSCAQADTQMANGRCEISRVMVGMKCGRGCQQVVTTSPAVVDRVCDVQGRCVIPEIPQNFELCADNDPCTTVNCDQDTQKYTGRCVKIGCAAGMCCCETGPNRMCATTASCTGAGKACTP